MLSKTLIGLEVAVALYYNYNNCSKEEEDHTKRLIVCQVYHSFSRFSRMLDVARRRADKDRGTFKGVATGLGPGMTGADFGDRPHSTAIIATLHFTRSFSIARVIS